MPEKKEDLSQNKKFLLMAFKGKIKRKLLFVTFMVIRIWQEWRWESFHVWVSWRYEENWEGQGGACQGDAADGGPGWRWVIKLRC